MNWTDDELMAYADGELVGERRAALAEALRSNADLRGRVTAVQTQRRRLAAAFGGVLEEPVPDRLTDLLSAPAAAAAPLKVVDLAPGRARRDARRAGPSWAQWGGMAASVALGVVLGVQVVPRSGDALVSEVGGQLVASGRLAHALGSQLAGEATGGVAVQLSFIDKDGQYCRTFSAERIAGLACHNASRWTVQTTAPAERAASSSMRQAGSPLPRVLLEAVDARIAGTALTAAEEQEARDRGWAK